MICQNRKTQTNLISSTYKLSPLNTGSLAQINENHIINRLSTIKGTIYHLKAKIQNHTQKLKNKHVKINLKYFKISIDISMY